MLCVYVDDIILISDKTKNAIKEISNVFITKEGSLGKSKRYIDIDADQTQTVDDRMIWSTSSWAYVRNVIKIVEDLILEDSHDVGLKKKVKNSLSLGYRSEHDMMDELREDMPLRYTQLI
eukprot:4678322-Ditylum_brightwellii.AAC.1